MNGLYYVFQTTGSNDPSNNFKLFLDSNGNIINNSNLEYGVYNKIVSLNYHRLFFIKIKKIGFGDIIDFITQYSGLKALIVYITNGNCGCEARRIKFNKFKIPYWFTIKSRELYDIDHKILSKNKNILFSKIEQKKENAEEIIVKNTKNKPLTKDTIKKSCGCGKKKLDKVST